MQGTMMPALKEAIVSGIVATATRRGPQKKLGGMGIIVLSGLVFFLALTFLTLASYTALAELYSPPFAYFLVGLALIVLSLITYAIGRAVMRTHEEKVHARSREEISQLVDVITQDLSADMAEPIRDNPKTSLAAAAIAGFLAGDRLH